MSWTDSRVFGAWLVNPAFANTASQPSGYTGLANDTVKAALFNGSATPDHTVLAASTGYNTGTWVTANEVTGASEWVAGGRALTVDSVGQNGGIAQYTAANITGSATLTMSGINGCLVYDASITGGTVAKQGVCYNYFGGSLSVTSGTFSITWTGLNVFQITT